MSYEARTAARHRLQAEELRDGAERGAQDPNVGDGGGVLANAAALEEIDRKKRLLGSQDGARNP
jgi:hypothetical protein